MTPLFFPPRFASSALILVACAVLSACSTLSLGEQRNAESEELVGRTDSDYEIVTCGEMAVIETSIIQRLTRLDETVENYVEQELLLSAQLKEIVQNRDLKGCPPPAAALRAETALANSSASTPTNPPVALEPAIRAIDSTPVPVAVNAPTATSGRFLQVGSFIDANNARKTSDHFANNGFSVQTRILTSRGADIHRVLVGPLADRPERVRAQAQASAIGINDAYFLNQ